jgi:hypothetical protein
MKAMAHSQAMFSIYKLLRCHEIPSGTLTKANQEEWFSMFFPDQKGVVS